MAAQLWGAPAEILQRLDLIELNKLSAEERFKRIVFSAYSEICQRPDCDRTKCFNLHPSVQRGLKCRTIYGNGTEARRSPFMCSDPKACAKAGLCEKNHNVLERMFHPLIFKTQKCSTCSFTREICAFIHENETFLPSMNQRKAWMEEWRRQQHSEHATSASKKGYKTEICREITEKDFCAFDSSCPYAHGEHELRGLATSATASAAEQGILTSTRSGWQTWQTNWNEQREICLSALLRRNEDIDLVLMSPENSSDPTAFVHFSGDQLQPTAWTFTLTNKRNTAVRIQLLEPLQCGSEFSLPQSLTNSLLTLQPLSRSQFTLHFLPHEQIWAKELRCLVGVRSAEAAEPSCCSLVRVSIAPELDARKSGTSRKSVEDGLAADPFTSDIFWADAFLAKEPASFALTEQIVQRIDAGALDELPPLTRETYKMRFAMLLWSEELCKRRKLCSLGMRSVKLSLVRSDERMAIVTAPLCREYNSSSVEIGTQLLVFGPNSTVWIGDIIRLNIDRAGSPDIVEFHCSPSIAEVCRRGVSCAYGFVFHRRRFENLHRVLSSASPEVAFPEAQPFWSEDTGMSGVIPKLVHTLDVDQARVVERVASSQWNGMLLVRGPFGTGKTTTLVECVAQTLNDPSNRVLVCTYTNSAADIYVRSLAALYTQNRKMLRIFPTQRRFNTVSKDLHRYCLFDSTGQAFRDPMWSDVAEVPILITTMTAAATLHDVLPKEFFTHIFVDEAAQANEVETLLPLYFAMPDTRVILAGDPLQMDPHVMDYQAIRHGLQISLFARLMLLPQCEGNIMYLRRNYRSCAEIVDLPSYLFYDSTLKSSVYPQKLNPWCEGVTSTYPLVFVGVSGSEQYTPLCNVAEAFEVVRRVQQLSTKHNFELENICVLTPYKGQVDLIRGLLRDASLDEIKVLNLHGVQGLEFDALFISTVRTTNTGLYDDEVVSLIQNRKMLNTTLSRAKHLVVAIGDPLILREDPDWLEYIRRCEEHGTAIDSAPPLTEEQVDTHWMLLNVESEIRAPGTQKAPSSLSATVSTLASLHTDLRDVTQSVALCAKRLEALQGSASLSTELLECIGATRQYHLRLKHLLAGQGGAAAARGEAGSTVSLFGLSIGEASANVIAAPSVGGATSNEGRRAAQAPQQQGRGRAALEQEELRLIERQMQLEQKKMQLGAMERELDAYLVHVGSVGQGLAFAESTQQRLDYVQLLGMHMQRRSHWEQVQGQVQLAAQAHQQAHREMEAQYYQQSQQGINQDHTPLSSFAQTFHPEVEKIKPPSTAPSSTKYRDAAASQPEKQTSTPTQAISKPSVIAKKIPAVSAAQVTPPSASAPKDEDPNLPQCPICSQFVFVKKRQDVNDAVMQHIDAGCPKEITKPAVKTAQDPKKIAPQPKQQQPLSAPKQQPPPSAQPLPQASKPKKSADPPSLKGKAIKMYVQEESASEALSAPCDSELGAPPPLLQMSEWGRDTDGQSFFTFCTGKIARRSDVGLRVIEATCSFCVDSDRPAGLVFVDNRCYCSVLPRHFNIDSKLMEVQNGELVFFVPAEVLRDPGAMRAGRTLSGGATLVHRSTQIYPAVIKDIDAVQRTGLLSCLAFVKSAVKQDKSVFHTLVAFDLPDKVVPCSGHRLQFKKLAFSMLAKRTQLKLIAVGLEIPQYSKTEAESQVYNNLNPLLQHVDIEQNAPNFTWILARYAHADVYVRSLVTISKEAMFSPIRTAIHNIWSGKPFRSSHVAQFHGCQFAGMTLCKSDLCLRFRIPHSRTINWEESRLLRSGNFVCISKDPMCQGADLVWGLVAASDPASLRRGFVSILPVTAPTTEIRGMHGMEIMRVIKQFQEIESFAIVDLFAPHCTAMRWTYSCLVQLFGRVESGNVPHHIAQILNVKRGPEFRPSPVTQTSDLDRYQQEALQYVMSPQGSVFRLVVGAAGTGKTRLAAACAVALSKSTALSSMSQLADSAYDLGVEVNAGDGFEDDDQTSVEEQRPVLVICPMPHKILSELKKRGGRDRPLVDLEKVVEASNKRSFSDATITREAKAICGSRVSSLPAMRRPRVTFDPEAASTKKAARRTVVNELLWDGSRLENLEQNWRQGRVAQIVERASNNHQKGESELLALLRKASIVVARSAAVTENIAILTKLGIERVVVLEAARISECELIGLLPFGTKKAVLIGDPFQLSPPAFFTALPTPSVSISKKGISQGPLYNEMSLMERLVSVGHDFVNLGIQHRMVAQITELSRCNDVLYPAHLLQDPEVALSSKSVFLRQILQQEGSSVAVLTHDWLPVPNESDVPVNISESRLVAQIVRVAVHDQASCSIGVLAMSKAQGLLIESLLREEAESMRQTLARLGVISDLPSSLNKVVVGTVDLFQGRSFDIVIVSLVHERPAGNNDFTSRRLRVAATRANQFLLVVGHEQACYNGRWGRVFEIVEPMDTKNVALHCSLHDSSISLSELEGAACGCKAPCNCEDGPKICKQHPCPLQCHPLLLHKNTFNCGRLCNKALGCGHRCQRPCMEQNCSNRCIHPTTVYMPLCGHFQQMPCEVKSMFPQQPLNCQSVFDLKNDSRAAGLDCRIEHLESVECGTCGARVIAPCGTDALNIHCIEMAETAGRVHIIHDRAPYQPRVLEPDWNYYRELLRESIVTELHSIRMDARWKDTPEGKAIVDRRQMGDLLFLKTLPDVRSHELVQYDFADDQGGDSDLDMVQMNMANYAHALVMGKRGPKSLLVVASSKATGKGRVATARHAVSQQAYVRYVIEFCYSLQLPDNLPSHLLLQILEMAEQSISETHGTRSHQQWTKPGASQNWAMKSLSLECQLQLSRVVVNDGDLVTLQEFLNRRKLNLPFLWSALYAHAQRFKSRMFTTFYQYWKDAVGASPSPVISIKFSEELDSKSKSRVSTLTVIGLCNPGQRELPNWTVSVNGKTLQSCSGVTFTGQEEYGRASVEIDADTIVQAQFGTRAQTLSHKGAITKSAATVAALKSERVMCVLPEFDQKVQWIDVRGVYEPAPLLYCVTVGERGIPPLGSCMVSQELIRVAVDAEVFSKVASIDPQQFVISVSTTSQILQVSAAVPVTPPESAAAAAGWEVALAMQKWYPSFCLTADTSEVDTMRTPGLLGVVCLEQRHKRSCLNKQRLLLIREEDVLVVEPAEKSTLVFRLSSTRLLTYLNKGLDIRSLPEIESVWLYARLWADSVRDLSLESVEAPAREIDSAKPLAAYLAHVPLRFKEVVHLSKQIALAVESLRLKGMAHLNLSPNTIFIHGPDLTTATVTLSPHSHRLATPVSESSVLDVSVPFSAPEVLQGRCDKVGKSDVWSLGMTMLEMLRRRPFCGISDSPPMSDSEISERIRVEGLVSAHVEELLQSSTEEDQSLLMAIASCLEYVSTKRVSANQLLLKLLALGENPLYAVAQGEKVEPAIAEDQEFCEGYESSDYDDLDDGYESLVHDSEAGTDAGGASEKDDGASVSSKLGFFDEMRTQADSSDDSDDSQDPLIFRRREK